MGKVIIRLTESDLHSIVKSVLDEIRNYKSPVHKIRAGAYAYGRGEEANDMVNDFLAKDAAIRDINRERAELRKKNGKRKYSDFYRYVDWNDLDIIPEPGQDLLSVDY